MIEARKRALIVSIPTDGSFYLSLGTFKSRIELHPEMIWMQIYFISIYITLFLIFLVGSLLFWVIYLQYKIKKK